MDGITSISDFDGLVSSLLDFIRFCFFISQSSQTYLIKISAVHLALTLLFPNLDKPSSLFSVLLILTADTLC